MKDYPKCTVSAQEVARVKGLGFLRDKTSEDRFNARVVTRNGKLSSAELAAVAKAAKKFGCGQAAMTSRMSIEIQGVPFANIEKLRAFLVKNGLETGGTGPKVRPVVSCKGTTCQYGRIDTFALSEEIHYRFYKGYGAVKLPHKFKIAVGGCPNNCVKPDLNDIGIVGQCLVDVDVAYCRGCKECKIQSGCPIGAAKMVEGRIEQGDDCNRCGRCAGNCPFGAFDAFENGFRVYIGGRWGKKVARGRALSPTFTDKEQVLQVIEKAILFFKENGIAGERFADTIERVGFERAQNIILTNEILERKDEILG